MKRIVIIALCSLLAFASAAIARSLGAITITTAVTALTTGPLQVARGAVPPSITVQCKLAYGSGGTTVSVWVQTSLDGGASWVDIANCSFTTATARFAYNLSSLTPVTTQYTPTDGSLTANTSKDGILGPSFRIKYTSTGTYAGNTLLSVDINGVPLSN